MRLFDKPPRIEEQKYGYNYSPKLALIVDITILAIVLITIITVSYGR